GGSARTAWTPLPSTSASCPGGYPGRTPTTRQPSAYAARGAAKASGVTVVTTARPPPGPRPPSRLASPLPPPSVRISPRETLLPACSKAGRSGARRNAVSRGPGNSVSSILLTPALRRRTTLLTVGDADQRRIRVKVIGAGFGRTGTRSLQAALE